MQILLGVVLREFPGIQAGEWYLETFYLIISAKQCGFRGNHGNKLPR